MKSKLRNLFRKRLSTLSKIPCLLLFLTVLRVKGLLAKFKEMCSLNFCIWHLNVSVICYKTHAVKSKAVLLSVEEINRWSLLANLQKRVKNTYSWNSQHSYGVQGLFLITAVLSSGAIWQLYVIYSYDLLIGEKERASLNASYRDGSSSSLIFTSAVK